MIDKLLVSYEEVDQTIDNIINQESSIPELVIGVMNGAKHIVERLQTHYSLPCVKIRVHTYSDKEMKKSGEIKIHIPLSTMKNIKKLDDEAEVWIWDDIFDTGTTMKMIVSLLRVFKPHVKIHIFTLYGRTTFFLKFVEEYDVTLTIHNLTTKWVVFPWEV